MKRWIGILILALLLSGCTQVPAAPTTTSPTQTTPPTTTAPAETEPVPDVRTQWYIELDGAYSAIAPMGETYLVFSSDTTKKIDPASGAVLASTAALPLPGSGLIQVIETGVSYYDAENGMLVYLDDQLSETGRYSLGEEICGMPYLAADGKTVYYCTPSGIRLWDCDTLINRNLKIMEGNWQGISGAIRDGQWLRCLLQLEDGTMQTVLISAENGETVASGDMLDHLSVSGDFYCCVTEDEWIFGTMDQRPQLLDLPQAIALPELQAAVTAAAVENGLQLDYYDLTTGLHTASELIPEATTVTGLMAWNGNLVFLSGNRLFTWCCDISAQLLPVEDDTVYAANRFTYDDPDLEGLAAAQERADALGKQYGLHILLWQDVTAAAPAGYSFGIEHRPYVFEKALDTLEATLAQFPDGFVKKASSWTEDKTLYIVLAADVSKPKGVCTATPGAPYLLGTNAYIALELGNDLQRSFYHCFAHVMDTYVLNNSGKYDQWNKLNPSGFSYDKTYSQPDHSGSKYLKGSNRYFVSALSMSYPVEDRATIFEQAMLPDNQAVFESQYMQAKLKRIHSALKDSFDLDGTYLWGQYVKK